MRCWGNVVPVKDVSDGISEHAVRKERIPKREINSQGFIFIALGNHSRFGRVIIPLFAERAGLLSFFILFVGKSQLDRFFAPFGRSE
jgi:hypothetical protein